MIFFSHPFVFGIFDQARELRAGGGGRAQEPRASGDDVGCPMREGGAGGFKRTCWISNRAWRPTASSTAAGFMARTAGEGSRRGACAGAVGFERGIVGAMVRLQVNVCILAAC